MHPLTIHPQLHLVGPPAQHQPGLGNGLRLLQLQPGRRANQPQPQLPPLATPRPNHQPPRCPIRTTLLAPRIVKGWAKPPSHLDAAPKWLEIPARMGWPQT